VLQRFIGPMPGQGFKLELLGEVKADQAVRQAVLKRQLVLEHYPGCDAAQAIRALASKLLG
jgi:flagellar biosynthesis protein FlhG